MQIDLASNVFKIFGLSAFAFALGISLEPILARYLYKYKMWKKKPYLEYDEAKGVASLQSGDELHTPRMGGILIWFSVFATVLIFWVLSKWTSSSVATRLNFFSRNQTWLPLFTLLSASLIGLADDLMVVFRKGGYEGGGISLKKRIFLVAVLGAIGAWWFYYKLGTHTIIAPFIGEIELGRSFIFVFIATMVLMFSGGVIDGIDGLSGGVFAAIFSAYGGIAFFRGQNDLATLCGVIVGGILAFLWFNIPPARFYMGETGILGLTTTLTVVAFLTKSAAALPIIAFPLIATTASNVIQVFSKKIYGRRVFKIAPLHHHFEAIGWPSCKVTMRYWILSVMFAVVGLVITLIG